MDDFKKKVHAEFDEAIDLLGRKTGFDGSKNEPSRFGYLTEIDWMAIKAFLDTTLDNLLVEVEGELKEHYWDSFENDRELVLAHIESVIARFKGEEKVWRKETGLS